MSRPFCSFSLQDLNMEKGIPSPGTSRDSDYETTTTTSTPDVESPETTCSDASLDSVFPDVSTMTSYRITGTPVPTKLSLYSLMQAASTMSQETMQKSESPDKDDFSSVQTKVESDDSVFDSFGGCLEASSSHRSSLSSQYSPSQSMSPSTMHDSQQQQQQARSSSRSRRPRILSHHKFRSPNNGVQGYAAQGLLDEDIKNVVVASTSKSTTLSPSTIAGGATSTSIGLTSTAPSDLQVAAELGKTLLDRNIKLQNKITTLEATIEDQAQEIEHARRQTAALRAVNDSRIRIYDRLEVSIQKLERANQRLVTDNAKDKTLIKSQCTRIENLEAQCEDLQKKIEEITKRHESLVRQKIASESTNSVQTQTAPWKAMVTPSGSIQQRAALYGQSSFQDADTDSRTLAILTNDEEITELRRQLREAQSQRTREQEKASELKDQLAILLQEHIALEEQLNILRSKAQEVQTLQEEINTLEEVRRDQLCGRCLRDMNSQNVDELIVMLNQEEYDDVNVIESYTNDAQRDAESYVQDSNTQDGVSTNLNPYRVLEEKYRALLDVQAGSTARLKNSSPTPCMSLQEELEMSGEYNILQNPISEPESQQESTKPISGKATCAKTEICEKKAFSVTPTEFSEADTVSSGFLEETSNKATQTEERSGSFLCTIADGEDCKLSIYDDNSPLDSRFRKTPEYKHLFKEIFNVLKKGTVAENEKLATATVQQAESSISVEEKIAGETIDDNQSVASPVSSSTESEPVQTPISSEIINEFKSETPHAHTKDEENEEQQNENRLDLSSIVTRRSSKKHSNKRVSSNDRSMTSDVIPTTNPKFVSTKLSFNKKRKVRTLTAVDLNDIACSIYTKTEESSSDERSNTSNTSLKHNSSFEYRDYESGTVSEKVAQLKHLEMSYAEVLRLPNKSKTNNRARN